MKLLKSDENKHQYSGPVAAKYLETLQRSNEQLVKVTSILQKKEGPASKSLSEEEYQSYRAARVEKLRQLYEENPVEIKKKWVLPKGETDGRKAQVVEEVIGEDFSPFDMPDFEEQMPDWTDYINKYME